MQTQQQPQQQVRSEHPLRHSEGDSHEVNFSIDYTAPWEVFRTAHNKLSRETNRIRTTRYWFLLGLISYTLLTWFPKSILIQFRRAANVYFLVITILTCMKFSPKVLSPENQPNRSPQL